MIWKGLAIFLKGFVVDRRYQADRIRSGPSTTHVEVRANSMDAVSALLATIIMYFDIQRLRDRVADLDGKMVLLQDPKVAKSEPIVYTS